MLVMQFLLPINLIIKDLKKHRQQPLNKKMGAMITKLVLLRTLKKLIDPFLTIFTPLLQPLRLKSGGDFL